MIEIRKLNVRLLHVFSGKRSVVMVVVVQRMIVFTNIVSIRVLSTAWHRLNNAVALSFLVSRNVSIYSKTATVNKRRICARSCSVIGSKNMRQLTDCSDFIGTKVAFIKLFLKVRNIYFQNSGLISILYFMQGVKAFCPSLGLFVMNPFRNKLFISN